MTIEEELSVCLEHAHANYSLDHLPPSSFKRRFPAAVFALASVSQGFFYHTRKYTQQLATLHLLSNGPLDMNELSRHMKHQKLHPACQLNCPTCRDFLCRYEQARFAHAVHFTGLDTALVALEQVEVAKWDYKCRRDMSEQERWQRLRKVRADDRAAQLAAREALVKMRQSLSWALTGVLLVMVAMMYFH